MIIDGQEGKMDVAKNDRLHVPTTKLELFRREPHFDMATFNDLPVEMMLEIIQMILPFNKYKPIIGDNAAWTSLNAYNDSIMYINSEDEMDESDPLPPSPISIHEDIMALRL